MLLKETILGIALSDSGTQAAVIEHEGPQHNLLAIDEWSNTLPLNGGNNGAGLNQFVGHVADFLRENQVHAEKASVALDTSQLFINTIPLEGGISRLERNDHVQWELSQYFPEAQEGEFITDVQPITDNRIEKWIKALSVSVRKPDANAVRKAVGLLGLDLHVVDVDHFGADTALRINYPDIERRYMALVGIKERRLDVSVIKSGVLESYSYSCVSSNSEILEHIETLSRETPGLFSITVYGTYLDLDLLAQIRRRSSLLVEALNPLRHVRVAGSLRLADHLTVPSFRFAAAVGVALRRD